jgi:hypothetical protein
VGFGEIARQVLFGGGLPLEFFDGIDQ